jgi:hypothetical protein
MCNLDLVNVVENGDVLTKGVIRKAWMNGTSTADEDIGPIFDKKLEMSSAKVIKGNIDGNGIIVPNVGGSYVFVLKDVDSGQNNCNSVKIADGVWKANYKIVEGIGDIGTPDDESGQYNVKFDTSEKHPAILLLTPITS